MGLSMIDIEFPIELIWLLRWSLFLAPLIAIATLCWMNRTDRSKLVGALFAFLYGLGLVFIINQIAIAAGWWRYGGQALMLMGIPADLWIGGTLLFGPVLSLAFPRVGPVMLVLPFIIGVHGIFFQSLEPLVYAGKGWVFGTLFVFSLAHIPAIYLARWTAQDRHLPLRAALLALGFGFLAFAVQPSLVMTAMGGNWHLNQLPLWRLIIGLPLLAVCFVLGISAVQMFVVHGEGTPIPLDSTKRLVQTGVYAYLINPMQLSCALSWVVIGFIVGNLWVAFSALMAWVFVAGMVRWHHRHDLLVRFPEGWPIYRNNVLEWRPRWRPWIAAPASIQYDGNNKTHVKLVKFLQVNAAIGLNFSNKPQSKITYQEPNETRYFYGLSAVAKALNHINFFWCLVAASLLVCILPFDYLRNLSSNLKAEHAATPR